MKEESKSSSDEEAYKNYYTNPQKRKQYDNVKLYQQQREMAKMSGHEDFKLEIPKNLTETQSTKNYATTALCCLTVTNPFREKVIKIVLNPWFDRFILVVIAVNCVFLAIDDPNKQQHRYQEIADMVFLILYTWEMLVKIVAMGFIRKPHSYMRDPWNILDFVVVLMGWFGYVVTTGNNVSALRGIRILRPLRTINSMPSMRVLVSSILNSLPQMVDIMILFSFVLFVFGTVGTQLYQGKFLQKCFTTSTNTVVSKENEGFCSKTSDCESGQYCGVWDRNPSLNGNSFDNIGIAILNVFVIITLEGWSDMMYMTRDVTGNYYNDFFFILCVVVGSFFVLNLLIAVQFSYLFVALDEAADEAKKLEEEREKDRGKIPLQDLLDKQVKEEEERKLALEQKEKEKQELKSKQHEKKKYDMMNKRGDQGKPYMIKKRFKEDEEEGDSSDSEGSGSSRQNPNHERHADSPNKDDNPPEEESKIEPDEGESAPEEEYVNDKEKKTLKYKLLTRPLANCEAKAKKHCKFYYWSSSKLKYVTDSLGFMVMIFILILINTLMLAVEHYDMPKLMETYLEYGNTVFTFVFLGEMILKLYALGVREYLKDGFNVFDGLVVIFGIIEFSGIIQSEGITVLRSFRLLRVFKLVKSLKTLRTLLVSVIQSITTIANLGLLMFLLCFLYSLIGMQFYGKKLVDDEGVTPRGNFSNFGNSMLLIFQILTGENWNEVMFIVNYNYGGYNFIYFTSMIVFGNLMLLNLFLAILLKNIQDNVDDGDGGVESGRDDTLDSEEMDYIQECLKLTDAQKPPTIPNTPDMSVDPEEVQEAVGKPKDGTKSSKSKSTEEGPVVVGDTPEKSVVKDSEMKREDSKSAYEAKDEIGSNDIDIGFEGGQSDDEKSRLNSEVDMEQVQVEGVEDAEFETIKEGATPHKRRESSYIDEINLDQLQDHQFSQLIHELKNQEEELEKIDKKDQQEYDRNILIQKNIKQQLKKKIRLQIKKKREENPIQGTSFFILRPKNKCRIWLINFIEHEYFENFIFYLIFLNSLLLALDAPAGIDNYSYSKSVLDLMVTIITFIFIGECAIKIVAYGFICHKDAYMRDGWNILDFFIVSFSVLNMVLTATVGANVSFLRGFRALRGLRPLRMVSKNEGMKTVVNSFLESIPALGNVMLISFLFYLIFAILFVQLFKGALGVCNDTSIETKAKCVGTYIPTGTTAAVDREWTVPPDNFDNIMRSLMTLFEISSLEMWPDVMYRVIDSQGYDMGPKENKNPQYAFLFVVFIFLTSFFIMNLFISVIVDKFNELQKKKNGSLTLTPEQKQWVKIQRIMLTVNTKIVPQQPKNKCRACFFKIVQNNIFEYFIMLCIALNTCTLGMEFYNQPAVYSLILDISNYVFVAIFTVECVFKIIGYGFMVYIKNTWNKFDFTIVVLSLSSIHPEFSIINVTALRIIRVARLLRMIKTSKGIRNLLKTLWLSLPNIMNVATLLMLLLFTFAVAGMDLFGKVPEGEFINKHANFQNFYLAMMTLIRSATGESWNGLMHDCMEEVGWLAVAYWCVFILMTFFIFLNIFIAVIYENYEEITAGENTSELLSIKRNDIKEFQSKWAEFVPSGSHFMPTIEFPRFLQALPPPLGYKGIPIERSKLYKLIFCLNIRDHQGKVYFPEVMWSIFHSLIGSNEDKVHHCEAVRSIMKALSVKYRHLGRKVTPDKLCGNKFSRQQVTVSKYLCAMKILEWWNKTKERRKEDMNAFEGSNDVPNPDDPKPNIMDGPDSPNASQVEDDSKYKLQKNMHSVHSDDEDDLDVDTRRELNQLAANPVQRSRPRHTHGSKSSNQGSAKGSMLSKEPSHKSQGSANLGTFNHHLNKPGMISKPRQSEEADPQFEIQK